MKRTLIAILFLCSFAVGQNPVGTTLVTATITDPHGTLYSNGTYSIKLSVPAGTQLNPVTGTLNSAGTFTVSLLPNTYVFTICAKDNTTCFTSTQAVSGSTQSLTSELSAASVPYYTAMLTAPKVGPAGVTFDDGTVQSTAGGGAAASIIAGTPTADQIASFVDSSHVQATACSFVSGGMSCPSYSGTLGDPDQGIEFPPNITQTPSSAGNFRQINIGGLPAVSIDTGIYNLIAIHGPTDVVAGSTYTVVRSDQDRTKNFTATNPTVTLPTMDPAIYPAGFSFIIKQSGSGDLAITSASLINGGSGGYTLPKFESVLVQSTGAAWLTTLKGIGSINGYTVYGNNTATLGVARPVSISEPMLPVSVLATKPSATLVAVANLTLSGNQTVDGVAGTNNQTIVLATAQTTGSQNGPWIMQSGAWTRPVWWPAAGTTQAVPFNTVFVRLGTVYAGSTWRMTTTSAVTIDTTATVWSQTIFGTWLATTGGGDASTNTASSVDSEVALFSGTAGKTLKRATGTGIARLASGVQSAAELSGDATTSGSNAVTVAKVQGIAIDATPPTTGQSLVATSTSAAHWATPAGGGDALVASPLSQFAATTSAQLLGVISDETGTGLSVFNSSPTFAGVTTFPNGTAAAPSAIWRTGFGISSPASTNLVLSVPTNNNTFDFNVGSTIGAQLNLSTAGGGVTVFRTSVAGYKMFLGGSLTTQTNSSLVLQNANSYTATTGGQYGTEAIGTFAPTSGTANFGALIVDPTINQTGGANGAVRILGAYPINTAVVGTEYLLGLGTSSTTGASATLTDKFTVDNSGNVVGAGNYSFSGAGNHINTQAATTDIAGTISISSATSGTKTFTTNYTNAPNCVISPKTDPTATGVWWVTTTTSTVVAHVATSGTIDFTYHCVAATN